MTFLIASLALTAPATSAQVLGLEPVLFTEVKIKDKFWAPKQLVNQKVSIPHTIKMCEETPRMNNFVVAASGADTGFKGLIFDDSDVYKSLEAAAYSLATNPDPQLEAKVDEWIAKIGAAQMPDGYLDTAYIIGKKDRRFTNLADDHELYCAGHLIEAAVAHYQATKKKTLLNIATKFADLLCNTFGEGKRMGYPGHPELELALVKLWRATGEQKYFDLAEFFVVNRGQRYFATEKKIPVDRFEGTYWLDDMPIHEHTEIKGHAVRAAYLFSGVADIVGQTKDPRLHRMLDQVWKNTVFKRVFVTGGIGPSSSNEGFTVDYDLPQRTAYQETCASIAMMLWNHRMGLLEGDAKYHDWVERAMYNGFLSGVSVKGDTFYYVNPLASVGNHHRQPWFACACCPPNVTRTMASLGQYLYAKGQDSLYFNQYVQSSVNTKVSGEDASFDVKTEFPWDGKVQIVANKSRSKKLAVKLRVPDWAEKVTLRLNGNREPLNIKNGYLELDRVWKKGDSVLLDLEMEVKRLEAHPLSTDNNGMTAFQRGPIVYCFEQIDNPGALNRTAVPLGAEFKPKFEKSLFGGITVLEGDGILAEERDWVNKLYQAPQVKPVKLRAIPYHLWDNREPTPMQVWMPYSPPVIKPRGLEGSAEVSLSTKTPLCYPNGINDGADVTSSSKHPGNLTHFWPQKGTTEWVAYTWSEAKTIKGVKVYWFDDTGAGECRPPESWEIEVLVGDQWVPVETKDKYGVQLNVWNEVKFNAVRTKSIRMKMKLQRQWSVGIHEWQILSDDN